MIQKVLLEIRVEWQIILAFGAAIQIVLCRSCGQHEGCLHFPVLYLIYVRVPVFVVLSLGRRAVDPGEEGWLGEVH